MKLFCPECKEEKEFFEVDCGPDTYDDDIAYTSYICEKCKIYCDGWNDNWYEEGTVWTDLDYSDIKPLFTSEQYDKLEKRYESTNVCEQK